MPFHIPFRPVESFRFLFLTDTQVRAQAIQWMMFTFIHFSARHSIFLPLRHSLNLKTYAFSISYFQLSQTHVLCAEMNEKMSGNLICQCKIISSCSFVQSKCWSRKTAYLCKLIEDRSHIKWKRMEVKCTALLNFFNIMSLFSGICLPIAIVFFCAGDTLIHFVGLSLAYSFL